MLDKFPGAGRIKEAWSSVKAELQYVAERTGRELRHAVPKETTAISHSAEIPDNWESITVCNVDEEFAQSLHRLELDGIYYWDDGKGTVTLSQNKHYHQGKRGRLNEVVDGFFSESCTVSVVA